MNQSTRFLAAAARIVAMVVANGDGEYDPIVDSVAAFLRNEFGSRIDASPNDGRAVTVARDELGSNHV